MNDVDSGEAASTKTAGETGDAASGAAADVNAAASIAAESGGDNDAVSDTSGDGVSNSNYGKSLTLTHFNKMRQDGGGMYLLDSSFSTVSTRTSTPGWSVKFKILSGTMKTKGTVMLQVVDVYTGSNAVKIDDGYMILTAADASNLYYQFQKFSVGDVVSLETSCYGNELLENAQWATGAGNIIVKDGAITDQSSWDSALKSVNPRSAVGIKADGTVIYYEIDGRQSGYSKGLTMKQLAQEFIDLGCVTAVNFDGGGSSAMAVKMPGYEDAKVISSPSDGSQRKCSTYVLLVVDGTSDFDSNGGDAGSNASGSDMNDDGQQTSGLVSNGGGSGDSGSVSNGAGSGISAITLVQAGTVVYQGASLNLSCKAFDKNYATIAAPSDTTMKVAEGYGNINGSVYNAGWVAGMEKIELASESAGVSSMSSVYVTNMLSSVNVTADGKSATSINASRGQQIQFDETAKYYGRDVVIGNNNFAYTLSGDDIAEISNTGLLTIKNDTNGGSATLTIAAGAVVKTVKITVASVFDDISGHWAEQYILDLYKSGIVGGVSAGRFSPQSEIKRADFMLMLYRAEGCPKVALTGTSDGIQNFADVADGAYYADAVMWAKGLGIAKGSGDMFRPRDSMTREEAFTFLYRYMNMKSSEDSTDDGTAMDGSVDDGGADSTGGGTVTSDATDDGTLKAGLADGEAVLADELSDNGANDEAVLADGSDDGVSAGVTNADVLTGLFKDASEISSYAAESVTALVNAGIVTGSNGMLRPKAKLTRAEMCKILYMTLNK